jgi:uncharacterized protein (DUF1778 family)
LETRITKALAVVRRAAKIQGRSVSDFVVSAAQDAAQKTVAEVEVIWLSREGTANRSPSEGGRPDNRERSPEYR